MLFKKKLIVPPCEWGTINWGKVQSLDDIKRLLKSSEFGSAIPINPLIEREIGDLLDIYGRGE